MFLSRDRVDETQAVGMQAEASQRIVGTAVFLVANDRMPQVLGMDTDLVLASGLQMKVHQRVSVVAHQHLVMCDGVFASIVGGTGIGDEHLVVLKPRLHRALSGFKPSFHHGHITAVIDFFLPVFLETHGYLLVLGEKHQP